MARPRKNVEIQPPDGEEETKTIENAKKEAEKSILQDSLEKKDQMYENTKTEVKTQKKCDQTPIFAEKMQKSDLIDILSVPRQKTDIPTLLSYIHAESNSRKYIILDINHEVLEKAWNAYKSDTGTTDIEDFLQMVYQITKKDVPRMYRAVAPLSLS